MNEDLDVFGRHRAREKRPLSDRTRRIAKALIGGVTILFLMGMGEAIIAAPALVPALWWATRSSAGVARAGFTLLAGLVVTEVGWLVAYITAGESQPWIILGPSLGFVVTVVLFTLGARRRGRNAGVSCSL
jgi:hypothetical protein